ncbi:MAG TPA: GH25 family lysozyme [Longimicrobium sp.]
MSFSLETERDSPGVAAMHSLPHDRSGDAGPGRFIRNAQQQEEFIMTQLEGIDVSHQEGVIDWPQVRDAGISFALIKATQGGTFVDPMVLKNLEACREVGIVPGVYHFYCHDVKPEDQAANFLGNLSSQPGDLIPAIDVETLADGAGKSMPPPAEVVAGLQVMVDAVRGEIGRAPMIYTYPSAWEDVTGNSSAFAGVCPLWIASYAVDTPTLRGGWTDYAVWQYTDHGTVNGIGGVVDRDRFNGGLAELTAFCLGALEKGGRAVLNQDGKVRSAPGVGSPEVGVLSGGTRVGITDGPVPVDGRDWWKIDDGAGTTGWSSSAVLSPA